MRILLVLLAALAGCGRATACGGLELTEGWIREAPPGANAMAGYARLSNRGDAPVTIESVASPAFGGAEVHRTVVEDGVSRMLRDQKLSVPPGGRAEFAPGGWHLMLFRPVRRLAAGDAVDIALTCGGKQRTYSFTVRKE